MTLKIVQILDTNTGKLMAFKGKTKSTPSAPGKQQKSRVPIESSDSEDEPSEEDSEEENGDYSEEESEEKPAPKKKSKAPASVRLVEFKSCYWPHIVYFISVTNEMTDVCCHRDPLN